ncbi:MAG TPA: bacteriohopanetetrol glucosamine biosynthesis glycosyltransferase HpnI [Caulobacteraceae bacterium]
MMVIHLLGAAALVLALVGSAYAAAAGAFAGRLVRPPFKPPEDLPAMTLLKPLCGAEIGLEANLSSFLLQDYAAPVQVIFGVQDPQDPALAAAESVRRAHPDADIAVVVDPRLYGANRKVSNLINMLAHAKHPVLVLSDADIAARPDYLARVAAALAEPGVGAVTCYYRGDARAGAASRLAAMGVSYGFLPNVIVGVALGLAKPCMGSTIALRRQLLDEIGGFEALNDVLMDDYDIGRGVRALGYRVVLPPFLVDHGCSEAGLGEVLAHEMRWAVTVRMIDPAGHIGSVVTHALAWALIGTALLAGAPIALAALAVALASRLWLKARIDRAAGASSGSAILMPIRDIMSFAIYCGSLFASAVYWRGERFRVSSGRPISPA